MDATEHGGQMKLAVAFIVLGTLAIVGSTSLIMAAPVPPALSALAFHAALVDQGPSPALLPGATTTYTLHFRNIGVTPWQRGGRTQVNLGVTGDSAKFADLGMAANWLSPNRVATTAEELVLPGAIGTFTFMVRAPATEGLYNVPLRPVADGITWLEDDLATVAVTSDLGYHSALVDQSSHPTLHPGETSGWLTVRFRNTGARTWMKGVLGQQVNLGVVGDDKTLLSLGVGWPSANRVAVQAEPAVGPGRFATFTFRVRAPTAPGTYPLRLRPVVDGLKWLDDNDVVSIITVVPAGTSTIAPIAATLETTAQAGNPKVALRQPTFSLSAATGTASVTIGGAEAITAIVTSPVASSSDIVGVTVYAPGGSTLASQTWFHNESFAAGDQRTYPVSWSVPAGSMVGTYTVGVSVYSSDWKTLYAVNPTAATFAVATTVLPGPTPTAAPVAAASTAATTASPSAAPNATTPGPTLPSFTSTATVAPASATLGGSVSVTDSVTSASATTALVDLEIWAPGAASVATYQVWFDNQRFTAGQQASYPATWQVPANATVGTYVVKLGVYAPGWATLYSYGDGATFSVAAATATTAPTATPTVTPTPLATATPTAAPTATPTAAPTATPTAAPTATPTPLATATPTAAPTATAAPTSTSPATGTPAPATPTPTPATPTPAPTPAFPGDPTGYIDQPTPNASVTGSLWTYGWSIDRNASGSATGVDRVVLYRDGPPGVGTLLGTATYGIARPDVATYFGSAEWTNSGWQFNWTVGALSAGTHTLYAESHSTVSGATKIMTQSVTIPGAATPTPAPTASPPPGGRLPAPAQAPSGYTVPAGAVSVSTSAGLVAALAAGVPQDIVLAPGTYDNAGPFTNANAHRVYSATLGGAVLRAGMVFGGNGSNTGGLVRGVAFDVNDSAKTLNDAIIHTWGNAGRGARILDTTFMGNYVVGRAIFARQPEGLVVQRVRVRNFRADGIRVDANVQNLVLATPVLLEDIDVSGVSYAVPKSSNGTAEACVWMGNTGTIRRALLRNCAWMGLWTGTSDNGSLHEDLDIDATPTGVYLEHFTHNSTFQRILIGAGVVTGLICEWADPGWGSLPACVDNVIQDSTVASSRVGVNLDQGTTRTTVQRVTFLGQSSAAIVDYLGINNSYSANDYSRIAPGAVAVSFAHGGP